MESNLTKIKPPYAPNLVLEYLRQRQINTNETRYWSAKQISWCTDLPVRTCRLILERFFADNLVARQTKYNGEKWYCLK